jgi:hypothetical protein
MDLVVFMVLGDFVILVQCAPFSGGLSDIGQV